MTLDEIRGPEEIKGLKISELEDLASEIRRKIIVTVAENGGHLAPSLGCVELALALHYVFQSPVDKIIWDVGHQAYAHKLITGRNDRFHTLRKLNGISGFLKPCESPHDIFGAGHSSTSISVSSGITVAREMLGENHQVVSVIGDGSLTAGLAFEALNHVGHLRKKHIVILNDNEMSIAPNVGALSGYLLKIRNEPVYRKVKEDIEQVMTYLPPIGKTLIHKLNRIKDQLKHLIVPGAFFEELGFRYYGPIDGHDFRQLISSLRWVKKEESPVLLHVLTRKGKGYEIAEKNPELFHGVGRFDIATGNVGKTSGLSYTSIFGRALVEIAAKNEKVAAITAAMPLGTGLVEFRERFPERYFDVGICEQHAVTFAAGMSVKGIKPVFAVYSSFLQRSFDQIIHDVAIPKLPVILALDRGGLVGQDGPTHHGVFDLSFLRMIPGLTLAVPRNGNMLVSLLKTAVSHENGPFAIRYPRGDSDLVSPDFQGEVLPVGKSQLLREGKDLLVIACGRMVTEAEKALDALTESGITADLLDPVFIRPLDSEMIVKLALKHKKIVTIEENVLAGGMGSAVLELLAAEGISRNVRCLGIKDSFVQHGTVEELLSLLKLDAAGIRSSLQDFINQTPEGFNGSEQPV